MKRHLLQDAQGSQLALGFDDLLDPLCSQRADEFILKVTVAHEEPALEVTGEQAPLAKVAKCCEANTFVGSDKATDVRRATHGDDLNASTVQINTAALGRGFDGEAIALAFNQYDGRRVVNYQFQPPATAGMMLTVSPAGTAVCKPAR